MFKFLKDKIKGAVSKISKKVEEETPKEEIIEEKPKKEPPKKPKKKVEKPKKKKEVKEKKKEVKSKVEETPKEEIIEEAKPEPKKEEEPKEEKKGFFGKIKEKFVHEEEPKTEEETPKPKEEKKGILGKLKEKITTTKISEDKFDDLFYDLELALLENNVAFEVVDKIKEDLKKDLMNKPIKRGEVEEVIIKSLKESIEDLFLTPKLDLIKKIKEKQEKPYAICFVGINGSGKTTSIAKVAHLLKKNKLSVVLAASDTFRAAAIQQLKEWGSKLKIKVIAHDYGSDPAAVAFDAIKYAKAHKIDIVLIDTAGRLHSNKDLLREMEKIVRVSKPDLKIFVGEAITGNDCTEQAKEFKNSVDIDAIILSKADVDEKGGAMVSTSFVTHRPIIYIGTGQELDDLKEFNKKEIMDNIGL